jgi:hypothetical protein
LQWAALVLSAGAQFHRSHFERLSAQCATTLGGRNEASPPSISASGRGRCRAAGAQTYPTHTIRLVVPFPPGGVFDAIGRPLAEKMRPTLGSVIVENIGGGGSSLGAAAVARARPDGYTILLGGTQHIIEAVMKSRPQYNPVKDLDPIVNVATTTFAIAVHPAVPAHNLKGKELSSGRWMPTPTARLYGFQSCRTGNQERRHLRTASALLSVATLRPAGR